MIGLLVIVKIQPYCKGSFYKHRGIVGWFTAQLALTIYSRFAVTNHHSLTLNIRN